MSGTMDETVNPDAADDPWVKQVFIYRTNERIRSASEGVRRLAEQYGADFLDLNAGITDRKGGTPLCSQ